MSNETNETIADIVADIRAQNQGLPEDSYALSPLVCDLLSLADRIEAAWKREREAGAEAAQICGEIGEMVGREAACKQSVTNCNRLGNVAKMREALEKADAVLILISKSAWFIDANFAVTKAVIEAGNAIEASLAELPRNCDRFINAKDALKAFERETGESMAIEFIKWLFAEAKGEAK